MVVVRAVRSRGHERVAGDGDAKGVYAHSMHYEFLVLDVR
jgi:hypothetical protein